MPSTYTTALRIEKPANGEQNLTWGDTLNRNSDLFDAAIAGVTTVNVTGQSVINLTASTGVTDQSRAAVLRVIGELSQNCAIVYPATPKTVMFLNDATSADPAFVVQIFQASSAINFKPGYGGLLVMDGTTVRLLGGAVLTVNAIQTVGTAMVGSTLSVGQSAVFGTSTETPTVSNAGYLNETGAGTGISGPTNFSISAASAVLAQRFFAASDARVKRNRAPITGKAGREWVMSAAPVTYVYDGEVRPSAGFIAQDQVRAGYGHLVMPTQQDGLAEATDPDGFVSPAGVRLNLDYMQTIAYLTAHAKLLESRLAALEAVNGP